MKWFCFFPIFFLFNPSFLFSDPIEEAYELREEGKIEEAILKVQSIPFKGNANAEKLLAKLFVDKEEYADAIQIYLRLCSEIKLSDCFNELGVAYIGIGLYQEALSSFEKATEISSGFAIGYSNQAQMHLILGNSKKAEIAHLNALKLSPNNPIIRINYGVYLIKNKKYQRAKDVLYPVVAENDSMYYAELYIGIAHYFREEYNSALIHFNRGLSINPEYYDLYYYRALLHYKKGDYFQSLNDLEIMDKLNPTNSKSAVLKKIIMKNTKL
jgi:tetratricopeptide (TPR) repeat protein